jgi:hypothetical protein
MAYLKEINKLKKEKEDLLRIVWAFSVVVERLKKKDAEDRRRPKSRKRG